MSKSIPTILDEIQSVLERLGMEEFADFARSLGGSKGSGRWFFTGQGRSGLVARMAAMRLMHLGHDVQIVGEATTPGITKAEHLVIFSASGQSPVTHHYAQIARQASAQVFLITANSTSAIAKLADLILEIPAQRSVQFGGSLFEQSSLLVWDALVLELTGGKTDRYEQMRHLHANLE